VFTVSPASGQVPLAVAVDAAGSTDPDGSIAAYEWTFGDGASASGVTANHAYLTTGAFTVTLTVRDNRGATASATRTVTATTPTLPDVQVSGRITFERVPFSATLGAGLDYPRTFEAPAREVVVDLVRTSDQAVLATASTDADGDYTLPAPANTDVFVRALAQSRFAGSTARPASWDLRVLDNTNANAQYVLDGSAFNTGVVDHVRNLKAATGWGGGFAGYTGTRAAAPFAILDTLYQAAQFVVAQGDAAAQLPALAAYWSPQNRASSDPPGVSVGNIGTTLYRSGDDDSGIYVLGDAGVDTDEFDQHVVAHEFQHYLEDKLSRTDTVGGPHALDERLDMRVSFSEGFANAFSGMVVGSPVYRDSFGGTQGSDSHFDMESRTSSVPGWYNEASVQAIAWDLFDAADDANDTVTLGYGPLFDVQRDDLRTGSPLTSLFPFITALKLRPNVPVSAVDARVAAEGRSGTSLGIDSVGMDAYATTETHSGVAPSSADLVLPVYTNISLGQSVRVCSAAELNVSDGPPRVTEPGLYNRLGNRRFLRFDLPGARTINITVECRRSDLTCGDTPQPPDPDLVLYRGGAIAVADSGDPNIESLVRTDAAAGDYVLEVYEYSHVDGSENTRGRTCMTVTIS
jgi:PKD repeat protein